MSDLDRIYEEREAKRVEADRQRRERHDVALAFLTELFERDIAPSATLARNGIAATLAGDRVLIHKTEAGAYADPFQIAVGVEGEIDVGGRSLGRYTAAEHVRMKRELINEILTFFDL